MRQEFDAQTNHLAMVIAHAAPSPPSNAFPVIESGLDNGSEVTKRDIEASTLQARAQQSRRSAVGPQISAAITTKIRFGIYFISRVWELNMHRSSQSWDFNLRSYNVRPQSTEIFQAVSEGDLLRVQQLLSSGKASLWDEADSSSTRSGYHRGLSHIAAANCHRTGTAVLQYLIDCGADINRGNERGQPPWHHLWRHPEGASLKQQDMHLAAALRSFVDHADWTFPTPTTRIVFRRDICTDTTALFPAWINPPAEVSTLLMSRLTLVEPKHLLQSLFPSLHSGYKFAMTGYGDVAITRAYLSKDVLPIALDESTMEDRSKLVKYILGQIGRQHPRNSREIARSILREIYQSGHLTSILSEFDAPGDFVNEFTCHARTSDLIRGDFALMNLFQRGLHQYIAELQKLGYDFAAIGDIEAKLLARLRSEESHNDRHLLSRQKLSSIKIHMVTICEKIEDSRLWCVDEIGDEWSGHFWDMVAHPERMMPGSWPDFCKCMLKSRSAYNFKSH